MANEQNLIQNSGRSRAEVEETNRKGGINSGKTRRRKRSMKEAMNLLLDLPVVSEENKKQLQLLGIDEKDANNQMMMMVAAFREAVSGNTQAMSFIAGITGSYAMSETDRQKIKIEKERLKLEKAKLEKNETDMDDGVEIIV